MEGNLFEGDKPVQIMYFDKTNPESDPNPASVPESSNSTPETNRKKRRKLIFCKEKIERILGGDRKRPVAVISMVGATKQGKSFYLGYLLRYLCALENNYEGDWMTLPLETFPFGRCERTQGMWLWSRPFHLKSKKNGKEIDILVMDTQGIFDRSYSDNEYCITVGLSLLISSSFIFNVKDNINEEVLQLLNKFLSFGIMAQDQNNLNIHNQKPTAQNQKPFRKLHFLIRDWNEPTEFSYGSEGGLAFIQDVLSPRDQDDSTSRTIRQKISSSFADIKCSLLPHPGQEFLNIKNPTSLELEPLFKSMLKESVESLLDLDNLENFPLCQLQGQGHGEVQEQRTPLTAPDVISAMEISVDKFNSQEIPTPDSTFDVTVKFVRATILNRIVDLYSENMPMIISHFQGSKESKESKASNLKTTPFYFDSHLSRLHTQAKELALKSLEEKCSSQRNDFDPYNSNPDLKLELLRKIEEIYLPLKQRNELMRLHSLYRAHDSSLESYKNMMKTKLQEIDFLSPESFDCISFKAENLAFQCFTNLYRYHPDPKNPEFPEPPENSSSSLKNVSYPLEFQNELSKLQEILHSEKISLSQLNQAKKEQAEENMKLDVEKTLQKFKDEVEVELDGKYYPESDFLEFTHNLQKITIKDFRHRKRCSNNQLLQEGESNLLQGFITTSFELQEAAHSIRERKEEELVATYRELLKSETEGKYTSDHDLFLKDIRLKADVFQDFQHNHFKFPEKFDTLFESGHFDQQRKEMEDELEKLSKEIKIKNEEISKPLLQDAEKRVDIYHEIMKDKLSSEFYPEQMEFQEFHQSTMEQIVVEFLREKRESHPELLDQAQSLLRFQIQHIFCSQLDKQAEKLRKNQREKMVEKYRELMQFEINERFLPTENLKEMHEIVHLKVFDDFRYLAFKVKKFHPDEVELILSNPEFNEVRLKIEEEFNLLVPLVHSSNEELENRLNNEVEKQVKEVFESNMKELEKCSDEDFDTCIKIQEILCQDRLSRAESTEIDSIFKKNPILKPRFKARLKEQVKTWRGKILQKRQRNRELWKKSLLGGLAVGGGVGLTALAIICPLAWPALGAAVAGVVGLEAGAGIAAVGAIIGGATGAVAGSAVGVATGAVVAAANTQGYDPMNEETNAEN